jgi:hypothetical protein
LTEEGFLKGQETHSYLAFVRHFGGLKMRFFNGHETFEPQLSSIHKASVRPFGGLTMGLFKGHETLGWRIYGFISCNFSSFWRTEKPIPAVSLNFTIHVNWFHISHSSTFWQNANVILQGLWDTRIKCILLQLSYYSVFSGLKLLFLKRPETLGSTLRGHLWSHIRHYRELKTRFLARRETLGYRYMCFVKAFLVITLPENTIP